MENKPQEAERKDSLKKSFNIDGLSELSQEFFEEILESAHGSPTKAIDHMCELARKNVEETASGPERVLIPPDCEWAMFDDEEGDVCIFGLKKPVRRAILPRRKLKYFRCDLCPLLDLKREEQRLIRKQAVKTTLPILINNFTAYQAHKDILLIAQKYGTTSPSRIAELILKIKGETRTPESISMWFRRHPDDLASLEALIAREPSEKERILQLQEAQKQFVIQNLPSNPQEPKGE
jgi:hypothetical protein